MPKSMPKKLNKKHVLLGYSSSSEGDIDDLENDELSIKRKIQSSFGKKHTSGVKKDNLVYPSAGAYNKYPYEDRCGIPYIRTLYSHFPQEQVNFGVLQLFTTLLIYLAIFPFVNFFWTYFFCESPDVVAMFYRITDNPVYQEGFLGHLRQLKWLTIPPITAETVSMFLAFVAKDFAVARLGNSYEFSTFCSAVGERISQKTRNWW